MMHFYTFVPCPLSNRLVVQSLYHILSYNTSNRSSPTGLLL